MTSMGYVTDDETVTRKFLNRLDKLCIEIGDIVLYIVRGW